MRPYLALVRELGLEGFREFLEQDPERAAQLFPLASRQMAQKFVEVAAHARWTPSIEVRPPSMGRTVPVM
jgi:hypothetical protein